MIDVPTNEPQLDLPDLDMFVRPGQAYLRSLVEQNLPTRHAALADARSYFDATIGDYERRLALTGLVGEALQLVEDTGALGNSFFRSPPGVGFFALAATYSPSAINVFFDGLHKRPLDDFARLAALGLGDRWVHDAFVHNPPLSAEEEAAAVAAHRATATLLRGHLILLRDQWRQFRRYFHAFKHGMLVADPGDVTVVADDQVTEVDRLVVWRRKTGLPICEASIEPPYEDVADWLNQTGTLAADVIDYLARQRLALMNCVAIGDDGSWRPLPIKGLPWTWWFNKSDLDPQSRAILTRRFGLEWK
jgi:hypothetical protein